MRDDIPLSELSSMLAGDIERVAEALRLDIKRRTPRILYCVSPNSVSMSPKLEVHLAPIRGKWNDWTVGKFGDALGLVAYCVGSSGDPKHTGDLRQAILWAKNYFGIAADSFDREAWMAKVRKVEAEQKVQQAKAAAELTRARKTAQGLWLAAQELTAGDDGWAYLSARGIDLAALPRRPRAIRFSPSQDWFDDQGEVRHVGPALMSMMTLPDGKPGSLHRIWINPLRPGEKADLSHIYDKAAVRKMWPSSEGAAIRLWRGESGLSLKEAAKANLVEDMVVCEGVEDGLSIALMTPELRVEAAGSLPGLLAWTPPKHVRCVIVAADNDWAKPQAQAMLDQACKRIRDDFGKVVRIARSPEGKDFNDLLRGQ